MFDYNSYHFIGIGGIGISAIARMLYLRGKKVSGSDNSESEITEDLKKLGIPVSIGHKAENLSKEAEAVIYTIAIPEENPELKEAQKRKIACVSYPEALGELSKKMFTIAISGTHGKTTTTAMVGHILKKAGLDPTIIVGSKMLGGTKEESTNFIAGKSQHLIVEACEYQRSFLNLYPQILVITNIDADHLDYYKDIYDIQNAFRELASQVSKEGRIIANMSEQNTKKALASAGAPVINYNSATDDIKIFLPGEHNVLNAKAAIAVAEVIGLHKTQALKYLEDFKGTWRRLEYKGEKNSDVFYDDYAHHPAEIRASLLALKQIHQDREIVCVFEPHQQGRTKIMFDDFVNTLKIADRVFIAPIFITREIADNSVSNKTLAEAVNKFTLSSPIENPNQLKMELNNNDSSRPRCIVLMGAGDIYKWTSTLMA